MWLYHLQNAKANNNINAVIPRELLERMREGILERTGTWGSGRGSFLHYFYIHSKVVASKEAVASEESGETKVVDRGNAMTKERGYDSGMRVTSCYC
eukprot:4950063-Prorocentrum_lima.AAC.1